MKLNNKGFSLIQVLISSGFLGAAAVVGIKVMNNQQKIAESTNQKFEMAYIHEEIWRALQNPLTCERTLKGKSIEDWNQGALTSINIPFKDGKYNNFIKIYKTYDSGFDFYGVRNLKIDNYRLSKSDKDSNLNLQVVFDRGKNILGSQMITKSIPITYSVENSIISSCNSLPLTETEEEESNSPKNLDSSIIKISLDSSIGENKKPVTSFDIFGNFSIKTPKHTPCSEKLKGSIRYNDTSSAYEFCTGSGDWKIWGKNRIDWQRSTKRIVNTGTKRLIGNFKYCSLSAISKAKIEDCKLEREVFDLKTNSDWFIFGSDNLNNGSCTFICFD